MPIGIKGVMKAHYLQHVPFEGLGSIESWLSEKNAKVSATKFFEDPTLPDLAEIDLLIVLGGPLSVNDEDTFDWLAPEKSFIREAIESGKSVLGVCLGAQLVACALGQEVFRNPEKEIGWFPISSEIVEDSKDYFQLPPEATVFHWHGETFDLPEGALHLASSPGCKNQAFQMGDRILGFQFHLETTPNNVRELINNCGEELMPSRYVQTAEEILKIPASVYPAINSLMANALDYLVR